MKGKCRYCETYYKEERQSGRVLTKLSVMLNIKHSHVVIEVKANVYD